MKIIVTGGAGFIGSALVRYIIEHTEHQVINIDKLTYAGHLESLSSVSNSDQYQFRQVDITNKQKLHSIFNAEKPDAVMHLAAESHVDRSIDSSSDFIETNIVGTYTLLEVSRAYCQEQYNGIRKIFVSFMFQPMKYMARWVKQALSAKRLPITLILLIPQARHRRITWLAPGRIPIICQPSYRTAPITMAHISFPKN